MNTAATEPTPGHSIWLAHADGRHTRMDRAKSIVRIAVDACLNSDPDLTTLAAALEQVEELIATSDQDCVAIENILRDCLQREVSR